MDDPTFKYDHDAPEQTRRRVYRVLGENRGLYRLPVKKPLSPRELEVLKLISQGKMNKEIARDLHIRQCTVEFHIANIYDKLEFRSRALAAIKAKELGL